MKTVEQVIDECMECLESAKRHTRSVQLNVKGEELTRATEDLIHAQGEMVTAMSHAIKIAAAL